MEAVGIAINYFVAGVSPGWYLYFTVLFFLWGACCGSFLNVCIYRIPRDLSVIKPRSHCPHCSQYIAWYDNIPLVSYLALRARCRRCGGPIAVRYFLVELLTAVLFLLIWLKYGPTAGSRPLGLAPMTSIWLVPVYWLAIFGLVLGTFVDFEHMIIPDRVTLGGIVLGVALSALLPEMHHAGRVTGALTWQQAVLPSLIGVILGSGILWLLAWLGRLVFRRDAMGFGDVKLLGAIGAFLGWKAVLFTIMMSSLAGSIVGVSLIFAGKKRMQSKIPYGPYLALAALVWILWGPALWNAYVSLLTPVR